MEKSLYKTYLTIDSFLTKIRKQAFILFLFIFVVLIIYSYCYQVNVTYDILYWSLSSVIQSLLALTALLVVGSIFKLQILHNKGEKIIDEMRLPSSPLSYHTGRPDEVLSLYEILEEIKKTLNKPDIKERRLEEIKQIINDILLSQELTKNFTLKFVIYNFFVAGLSLIFLVFTPLISNYYFGIPTLYLIVFLFINSLFLVMKGIINSLWQ